jgi:hypothetical protein
MTPFSRVKNIGEDIVQPTVASLQVSNLYKINCKEAEKALDKTAAFQYHYTRPKETRY